MLKVSVLGSWEISFYVLQQNHAQYQIHCAHAADSAQKHSKHVAPRQILSKGVRKSSNRDNM